MTDNNLRRAVALYLAALDSSRNGGPIPSLVEAEKNLRLVWEALWTTERKP